MKKTAFTLCLILVGLFMNAQTPCGFKYGRTEADSLKSLEQISQFRVFYDQKNYADAYPSWQYIVENSPCAWEGVYTYAQTMFVTGLQPDGFPHSDISGSIPVCRSPELFAAYHVLLRFWKPRHPPFALLLFLVFVNQIPQTISSLTTCLVLPMKL